MNLNVLLTIAVLGAANAALAQDRSVEIYGARSFEGELNVFDTDFDVNSGFGVGVGTYWRNGALEYGADLMYSKREYSGYEPNNVAAISLMGVGRYHFALGSSVDAYIGAGLGGISVAYEAADFDSIYNGSEVVFGGQISLGASFALGNGAVFGEVKYQTAFDDAEIALGEEQSYDSSFALIGYKFNF